MKVTVTIYRGCEIGRLDRGWWMIRRLDDGMHWFATSQRKAKQSVDAMYAAWHDAWLEQWTAGDGVAIKAES